MRKLLRFLLLGWWMVPMCWLFLWPLVWLFGASTKEATKFTLEMSRFFLCLDD